VIFERKLLDKTKYIQQLNGIVCFKNEFSILISKQIHTKITFVFEPGKNNMLGVSLSPSF
jgi:hypothetical protein